MAIINQRWPRYLAPSSCAWGRTRNDDLQTSPRTRETSVIVQGRPLWTADLTWNRPNDPRLPQIQYLLDALEGYRGSVQIWDFSSPYPVTNLTGSFNTGASSLSWGGTGGPTGWTFAGLRSRFFYTPTLTLVGSAAINATTVNVSGCIPNKVVVFQGQHVQIGRRCYVASSGAIADGSGNATLTLLTGLLSAATSGDSVRVVEAACEMRLAEQEWSKSAQAGQAFQIVRARFIETVTDFS